LRADLIETRSRMDLGRRGVVLKDIDFSSRLCRTASICILSQQQFTLIHGSGEQNLQILIRYRAIISVEVRYTPLN